MKKIMIWSDCDLDGVGCVLALKWFLPNTYDINYKNTTVKNFREEFLEWLKNDNLDNYDLIFITDLDVGYCKDIVDRKNVYIIDHHDSHLNTEYNNCKHIIEKYDSATGLIMNHLLKNKPISKERQALLLLINDYDSFALKYKYTKDLNVIFWSLNGNRCLKFIEMYKDGFKPFDKFQQNTIDLYNKKLQNLLDNIQLFEGSITFNNITYKAISVMADFAINDVADYIINKGYDVGIVVNLKTMLVSFRKSKTCNLKLNEFAALYDGGGHEVASGCPLNEQFQELLKQFKKI